MRARVAFLIDYVQMIMYKKVRRTAGLVPEDVRNLRRPVRRCSKVGSIVAIAVQSVLATPITQSDMGYLHPRLNCLSPVVIRVTAIIVVIIGVFRPGILFPLYWEDVHESSENPETIVKL